MLNDFRYYIPTDFTLVHYAAVALNSEMKSDQFATKWQDPQDCIRNAEKEVHNLWTIEYKRTLREKITSSCLFAIPITVQEENGSSIPPRESSCSTTSQFTLSEFGPLPSWEKYKWARIAANKLDPYD